MIGRERGVKGSPGWLPDFWVGHQVIGIPLSKVGQEAAGEGWVGETAVPSSVD